MQGAIERYARKFNLLEVRVDSQAPVSSRTLNRWRKAVPPTFAFSVVLPNVVTELRASAQAQAALELSIETATVLQAPAIVIANPPSVTPTAAHRRGLERLVERLPRDAVKIAWEPAGLWEPDMTRAIALDLGLVLIADASKDTLAPGAVAYTRIRGLGDYRRLSSTRIDALVQHTRGYRELFAVIETDGPTAIATALRAAADEASLVERMPRTRYVDFSLHADDEEQE